MLPFVQTCRRTAGYPNRRSIRIIVTPGLNGHWGNASTLLKENDERDVTGLNCDNCRDAAMSPSKLNSWLAGVFYAIVFAVGSSVMAQDGLRLFSPLDSNSSFGGGRRGNDGVYSSVSGIHWSISTPTGGYIGATTAKGDEERRRVHDPYSVDVGTQRGQDFTQTNSVRINGMSHATSLGTRFEVGNRRGHHGWLIGGYSLPGQSHSMSVQNVEMVIRDEGRTTHHVDTIGLGGSNLFVWNIPTDTLQQITIPVNTPSMVIDVGYLWGYYVSPVTGNAFYAPLPVMFENIGVGIRSTHQSVELMYTYRTHPFTWGGMELLAGARYWEFDDSFGLYAGAILDSPVTLFRPSALSGMSVDARAINRIVGPQFGIKLSRHNARWTFGAEGRLTGGINVQSLRTEGFIASGEYPPAGMRNTSFGHRQNKTVFSPIGELRLTADFRLTNAVSIFGGVDGMFAGNVARAVRVTDYVVSNDQIFGIRGNDRNTTVFVYGASFGVKVSR